MPDTVEHPVSAATSAINNKIRMVAPFRFGPSVAGYILLI
jgi:hypothetical protein